MIFAGTGHRPDKLGGYGNDVRDKLRDLLVSTLEAYAPTQVISGMALGYDMALAEAAIECNIPLIAAVPCSSQADRWNLKDKERWDLLLSKASEVQILSTTYHAGVMQTRNVWMVDRCDLLVALWDGSDGGTCNCVKYAKKVDKPIINLWAIYQAL
jgi:uncharacterized phage-like protein YoqJ